MTHNRMRPNGFSFTEVLFAVMILGIGFIMVAAIFPVALVQSKLTQEETVGQSIAKGGANYIEQIATDDTMPATGNNVVAMDRMPKVQGKLMLAADSRLAWVPFYRRAAGSPSAQLYMIPTAVRNSSVYEKGINGFVPPAIQSALPAITKDSDYNGTAVLAANVVDSTESGNTLGVDYIEFPASAGNNDTADNYTAVAEGSYVIIARLSPTLATPGEDRRVGHILRIGGPADTQPAGATYPRRWTLVPGYDYVPQPGEFTAPFDGTRSGLNEATGPLTLHQVGVFVVGRSLANPAAAWNATTNAREGIGQEIGAYTTFVAIR